MISISTSHSVSRGSTTIAVVRIRRVPNSLSYSRSAFVPRAKAGSSGRMKLRS